MNVTYSAELIAGSSAYVGLVWIDGAVHRCQHKHTGGFTSAKSCSDLRTIVAAAKVEA